MSDTHEGARQTAQGCEKTWQSIEGRGANSSQPRAESQPGARRAGGPGSEHLQKHAPGLVLDLLGLSLWKSDSICLSQKLLR